MPGNYNFSQDELFSGVDKEGNLVLRDPEKFKAEGKHKHYGRSGISSEGLPEGYFDDTDTPAPDTPAPDTPAVAKVEEQPWAARALRAGVSSIGGTPSITGPIASSLFRPLIDSYLKGEEPGFEKRYPLPGEKPPLRSAPFVLADRAATGLSRMLPGAGKWAVENMPWTAFLGAYQYGPGGGLVRKGIASALSSKEKAKEGEEGISTEPSKPKLSSPQDPFVRAMGAGDLSWELFKSTRETGPGYYDALDAKKKPEDKSGYDFSQVHARPVHERLLYTPADPEAEALGPPSGPTERYSEKTTTFQLPEWSGNEWVTFPSVLDELGTISSPDAVRQYVIENGPFDPLTGEQFPKFSTEEEALDYAKKRSSAKDTIPRLRDIDPVKLSPDQRLARVADIWSVPGFGGTPPEELTKEQVESLTEALRESEELSRKEVQQLLRTAVDKEEISEEEAEALLGNLVSSKYPDWISQPINPPPWDPYGAYYEELVPREADRELFNLHQRLAYHVNSDPNSSAVSELGDAIDRSTAEGFQDLMDALAVHNADFNFLDITSGEMKSGLENLERASLTGAYDPRRINLDELGPEAQKLHSVLSTLPAWLRAAVFPSYGPLDRDLDLLMLAASGVSAVATGGISPAAILSAAFLKNTAKPYLGTRPAARLLLNLTGDLDNNLRRSVLAKYRIDALRRRVLAQNKLDTDLFDSLRAAAEVTPTHAVLSQLRKAEARQAAGRAHLARVDKARKNADAIYDKAAKNWNLSGAGAMGVRSVELAARNVGYSLLYNASGNAYYAGVAPEDHNVFEGIFIGALGAGALVRMKNVGVGAARRIRDKPSWSGAWAESPPDPFLEYLEKAPRPNIVSRLFGGDYVAYGKLPKERNKTILARLGLISPEKHKVSAADQKLAPIIRALREYHFKPAETRIEEGTIPAEKGTPMPDPLGAILHKDVARVLDRIPLSAVDEFSIDEYAALYRDILQYGDDSFFHSWKAKIEEALELMPMSPETRQMGVEFLAGVNEVHRYIKRLRKIEEDTGTALLPKELSSDIEQFLRDRHEYYFGPESTIETGAAGKMGRVTPYTDADAPRVNIDPSATRDGAVGSGAQSARIARTPGKDEVVYEGRLDATGDELTISQGDLRVRMVRTAEGVEATLERRKKVPGKERTAIANEYDTLSVEEGATRGAPFSLLAEQTGDFLKFIEPKLVKENLGDARSAEEILSYLEEFSRQGGYRIGNDLIEALHQVVDNGTHRAMLGGKARLKGSGLRALYGAPVPKMADLMEKALRVENPDRVLSQIERDYTKLALTLTTYPKKGALGSRIAKFNAFKADYFGVPKSEFEVVGATQKFLERAPLHSTRRATTHALPFAKPDTVYHVTSTRVVDSIRKSGLLVDKDIPLSDKWKRIDPDTHRGVEIHAFDNLESAAAWALKMDWDLTGKWGTGDVSIVKIRTNLSDHDIMGVPSWEIDTKMMTENPGALLSTKSVPPQDILGAIKVDSTQPFWLSEPWIRLGKLSDWAKTLESKFDQEAVSRAQAEPKLGAKVKTPDRAGPQFDKLDIDSVVNKQLNRLHRAQKKKNLKPIKDPSRRVRIPVPVERIPPPKGVTVVRGTAASEKNADALKGRDIPHSELPTVLWGVSISGKPRKLQASSRMVRKTDPNVSLFTSEGTAVSFVLNFSSAVMVARAEAALNKRLAASHRGVPAALVSTIFEEVSKGGPITRHQYDVLREGLEELHRAIVVDRHMGVIPNELYYSSLDKWMNPASESGRQFWKKNNYSPTEVYKAYIRERNAALGVPGANITLTASELAKRRIQNMALTRVRTSDIPGEALVVGDIPGAVNNVRVFASDIVPSHFRYVDEMPFEMLLANSPVNRLGIRVVPRDVEAEIWRPRTEIEKAGRSKGKGLSPRQRDEESLLGTVSGGTLKPGDPERVSSVTRLQQPDSTESFLEMMYQPWRDRQGGEGRFTTWHSKFLPSYAEGADKNVPQIIREALDDVNGYRMLVEGEWDNELSDYVWRIIEQSHPFFGVSKGLRGFKEIWAGERPHLARRDDMEIVVTKDPFTGEATRQRAHPTTTEVELLIGGERKKTRVLGPRKKPTPLLTTKKGFVGRVAEKDLVEGTIPVRLTSGDLAWEGRKDLRNWLDREAEGRSFPEARKQLWEKRILLGNLWRHLKAKGKPFPLSMISGFRNIFSLPDVSPQSKAAAFIIIAQQGAYRSHMNSLYKTRIAEKTFNNMVGKKNIEDIERTLEALTQKNSETAWQIIPEELRRNADDGQAYKWQRINAYWHGVPEDDFRTGAWAMMENGDTPPNPPSTQRLIDKAEQEGVKWDTYLGPEDLTGSEIKLIRDILDDTYMQSAMTEILDMIIKSAPRDEKEWLKALPTTTKQIDDVLGSFFENYFPRSYDMVATREARARALATMGGRWSEEIGKESNAPKLPPHISGISLHRNPFEASTPSEALVRDRYRELRDSSARMEGSGPTPMEKVFGPRRNTYKVLTELGYDPTRFGFLGGGFDRISEMIKSDFIPATSNMVELYQFKRFEIDKWLLRKKVYRMLQESGVIRKITEDEWSTLQHDLAVHGIALGTHLGIIGAGKGMRKKVASLNSYLAGVLDRDVVHGLKDNELLVIPNSAAEVLERWTRPVNIYSSQYGGGVGDGLRRMRDMNNVLQQVQLGLGWFHLGTMFSESMGSSLETMMTGIGASAKHSLKEGIDPTARIKYPRGYVGVDEKTGKVVTGKEADKLPNPEEPQLQTWSWLVGRAVKSLLYGVGVVRDAGHTDTLLPGRIGSTSPTGKGDRFLYVRKFPLKATASFYGWLKRDSLLETSVNKGVKKAYIKFAEWAKKDPPKGRQWKDDPISLSTNVLRNGAPLNTQDKSLGALFNLIAVGDVPAKNVDPVFREIVSQAILSNFTFPSQKYSRAYQRRTLSTGRNEIMEGQRVWERGGVWLGMPAPGKKAAKEFKNMAESVVNFGAWMFDDMIPQAKMAAFVERYRSELQHLGPDATPARMRKRAQHIWDSIDNRFGIVQYDNLFWNKTMLQYFQLLFRAVGWNMGTLKEVIWGGPMDLAKWGTLKTVRGGEAVMGLPKEARAKSVGGIEDWSTRAGYTLAMLPWKVAQGMMVEFALTGDTPFSRVDWSENPEWNLARNTYHNLIKNFSYFIAPRDGQVDAYGRPTYMTFPDYSKDLAQLHLALSRGWGEGVSQLFTMVGHKLSPIVQVAEQTARGYAGDNKSFWGQEIIPTNGSWWEGPASLAQQAVTPFVVGTMEEQQRKNKPWIFTILSSFFGIQPASAIFRTTPAKQALFDESGRHYPPLTNAAAKFKELTTYINKATAKRWNSDDPAKVAEAGQAIHNGLQIVYESDVGWVMQYFPEFWGMFYGEDSLEDVINRKVSSTLADVQTPTAQGIVSRLEDSIEPKLTSDSLFSGSQVTFVDREIGTFSKRLNAIANDAKGKSLYRVMKVLVSATDEELAMIMLGDEKGQQKLLQEPVLEGATTISYIHDALVNDKDEYDYGDRGRLIEMFNTMWMERGPTVENMASIISIVQNIMEGHHPATNSNVQAATSLIRDTGFTPEMKLMLENMLRSGKLSQEAEVVGAANAY